MLYRRGRVWWYKLQFAGRMFRESARTKSKSLALKGEREQEEVLMLPALH